MNVVRLMGGIGNQFFQYAFGRMLEERGKEVKYDLSWFGQYTGGVQSDKHPRIYRMDKFNAKIKLSKLIPENHLIMEQGFNDKLFELDNCNFEGYWQYIGYYESLLSSFRKELSLKHEVKTEEFKRLATELIACESIGVHVRRGDYIGLWPIMSMNYYTEAINKIRGDLYIFSDDPAWCKSAFKNTGRKVTFVDMEDYLAFELLRLCKYKITGNSTFSWWAAWLGGGLVFCPKGWLGFKQNVGPEQRYPKEWIQIS